MAVTESIHQYAFERTNEHFMKNSQLKFSKKILAYGKFL